MQHTVYLFDRFQLDVPAAPHRSLRQIARQDAFWYGVAFGLTLAGVVLAAVGTLR